MMHVVLHVIGVLLMRCIEQTHPYVYNDTTGETIQYTYDPSYGSNKLNVGDGGKNLFRVHRHNGQVIIKFNKPKMKYRKNYYGTRDIHGQSVVFNGRTQNSNSKNYIEGLTQVTKLKFKNSPSIEHTGMPKQQQLNIERITKTTDNQIMKTYELAKKYKKITMYINKNKKTVNHLQQKQRGYTKFVKLMIKHLRINGIKIKKNKQHGMRQMQKLKNNIMLQRNVKAIATQDKMFKGLKGKLARLTKTINALTTNIKEAVKKNSQSRTTVTGQLKKIQTMIRILRERVRKNSATVNYKLSGEMSKDIQKAYKYSKALHQRIERYERQDKKQLKLIAAMVLKITIITKKIEKLHISIHQYQAWFTKYLEQIERRAKMIAIAERKHKKILSKHGIILQQLKTANCSRNWLYHDELCYKLYECQKTRPCEFSHAIHYCKRQGGDLVKVRKKSDNEFLSYYGSQHKLDYIMIDGSDRINEGVWMYKNGRLVNVDYREDKKPYRDKHCLVLVVNTQKWRSTSCYKRQKGSVAYVCERNTGY